MTTWQIALTVGVGFAIFSILLTISRQLDRLIKEVHYLRIEYRSVTGVEPAGMTLAREANAGRDWASKA